MLALNALPPAESSVLVAVSGGLDSCVLLHLLTQHPLRLQVATFDHGLRPESAADADFVAAQAAHYGLPCVRGRAEDLRAGVGNLEAKARQARYQFLLESALACGAEYIALGHHQDDQAETVLLHLLRGAGLEGLAGLRPRAPFSAAHLPPNAPPFLYEALEEVQLWRPLLAWSRADLQAYAQAQGLLFRHDPSNNDLSLRRNRLRYEILPLLESFNPQVKASLARTASLLQADAHIVEEAVWAALGRLAEWESESAVYVERAGFLALPEGLQRGLLRALFRDLAPLGTGELSAQQVLKACSFIAENRAPAALNLPAEVWLTLGYDGFSLHLGRDLPYPLGLPHLSKGRVVPLDPASVKRLENGWELYSYWVHEGRSPHVKNEDPFEVTLALPPNAELNLRTRREGDKFTPLGMEGRQKRLSDVFSNLKIPHGLRERVPLLTINDQIAWFVAPSANGIVQRVGAAFAVKPDSADILRLRWRQTEAESSGRA